MQWESLLAIYVLFVVLALFLVLPFGVRTHDEAGIAKVRGQADSAPAEFSLLRMIVRTLTVATILFALYYANYVNGWIDRSMIDRLFPPLS